MTAQMEIWLQMQNDVQMSWDNPMIIFQTELNYDTTNKKTHLTCFLDVFHCTENWAHHHPADV